MSLAPTVVFGQFTSAESAFLSTLAGLSYSDGDILYASSGELTNLGIGTTGQVIRVSAGGVPEWATLAGTGDVTAAAAFGTDNVLVRSDGTGKGVQATGISVDDSDNISGVNQITADGIIIATNEFQVGSTGSAADPAYTYASDGTTGFFFPSAGEVGYTSGGTEVLRFTADGIDLQAGTLIDVNSISFNSIAAPTHSEGLVYYDSTRKTLTYYNDEADVALNIGTENYIRVRNTTGSTITKGQAVYVNGAQGANLPTVDLAQADTQATARCIGLATHDIENNSNGYITTLGTVSGLNTSAFSAGVPVYLSTTVAGGLTTTRPTTGFAVVIGEVTISNVSTGEIKVIPGTTVQRANLQVEPSEGAFVDGDKTKLDGIEPLADVTDTAKVTAAGALMDSEVDADLKTLSLPANTTISVYGASLIDDADAATARTTLGLGSLSTLSSVDADSTTVSNLEVDNFKASAIVTEVEGISANDNDTTVPTSAAVKDYVDNNAGSLPTADKFRATTTSGAEGVVVFGTVDFDTGSDYDNTTGIYTAPVTGYYLINVNLQASDNSSSAAEIKVQLQVNGTAVTEVADVLSDTQDGGATISEVLSLTAGDEVRVSWSSVQIGTLLGTSSFSGYQMTANTVTAGISTFADVEVTGHIYADGEVDNGNSGTADTIDWGAGNFQKSTMTGNCTYTFTAPDGPGRYQVMLVQDATGSRTATWPAAVKWPGGTAPTLSTAASSIDIITFYYDGTNYYGVDTLDFQ